MPFDNDPRGIFYNKTAFKEAGIKDPWDAQQGNWTWADMEDAARKLTKKEGDKITRYGLAWNYTHYQEFSPLVWTLGGNYANWTTLKYTLDDPKVLEAHKMLYKWVNDDKILVSKSVSSGVYGADDTHVKAFQGGFVGMVHAASYYVSGTAEAIGSKFEWDVAPFPNKDAAMLGTPVTSGNPHFVWKGSKNPEAAYKWLRTLSSEEFQSPLGKAKVMVPANKKAWKAYQTAEPPKHAESFIKWIYGRPHGFHFYNAGAAAAGDAILAELDLAYLGKQTLEQALAKAQTVANSVVNFGKAKNPFAFTVPKPAEKDLAKWGVA
jgi:multiple sugar transport system substrate-binding protein